MPYIKQQQREYFEEIMKALGHAYIGNPGELNYLLTRVIMQYSSTRSKNYQIYNDIIGALEACKLEFYRRQVAEYEDTKISENGEVYE